MPNTDKRHLIKLGGKNLVALSRIYVNQNDKLYENALKIKPIEGYDDYVSHGEDGRYLLYESNTGENALYTAAEFADMLRKDPEYRGGDIRLLSCSAGAGDNSIAQNLADIMGVNVLAPTEDLYVGEEGELFITNYPALADMWNDGEQINQTGEWKLFSPKGKEG